jgi:hypothetical protein
MRGAQVSGLLLLAASVAQPVGPTSAEVPPADAQRLRGELTPLGAERAGNAEQTIPAWEGGYTTLWPGYRSGQPRPDPFASETPRLRISAANLGQHAGKLSEGVRALLGRYPSYRLDVYPTHRTAAAPSWVYENTFRNATRVRTRHDGRSIEAAFGGIPFPIPRTGAEAIWNHLLAWKGEAASYQYATYLVAAGKPLLATGADLDLQFPYYDRREKLETFGGVFLMTRTSTTAPPFRAGEKVLTIDAVDQVEDGRKSWQYLVGQRRIRRAPTIAYDNPSFVSSGFSFFDEIFLFNGAIDRYVWKLLGKQEMYVPYNAHRFHVAPIAALLGPAHPDPSHLRWELHRVWVVEASLAADKRHVMPRRRFYLDEDTWLALLSDGWDARGQLWHVAQAVPFIAPELPGVVTAPYLIFDLVKRGYVASSLFNEGRRHYQVSEPRPAAHFSPAALAAEGIR